MSTDLLFIHAQQALRSVPASGWDSTGYAMFVSSSSPLNPTEEERLFAWKEGIRYLHASKSAKFYAYARANGRFADVTTEQVDREQAEQIETEISEWNDAKFKMVERVSDTLTFLTTTDRSFDITTDDIFSQALFRKAYFRGTNKMLPEISRKAYQAFIERLPFTVAEGYSQTKKDMIEDTLREIAKKLDNMKVDTEKEAMELTLLRGVAVYDRFLFFKFSALMGELRQNNRPYEQQAITVALKYAGARQVHNREGNYWIYDYKSEPEIPEPKPTTPVQHDLPEPPVGTDGSSDPF